MARMRYRRPAQLPLLVSAVLLLLLPETKAQPRQQPQGNYYQPQSQLINNYAGIYTNAASNDPLCPSSSFQLMENCYGQYLDRLGLSLSPGGRLPPFVMVKSYVSPFTYEQLCNDWRRLDACLASVRLACVSTPVFLRLARTTADAELYFDMHAANEYFCEGGKDAFVASEPCLRDAFGLGGIHEKLAACGGETAPKDLNPTAMCSIARSATNCVRDSLRRACGRSAGDAVCHAAVNIARRAANVDSICLAELDRQCDGASTLHISSFVLLTGIVVALFLNSSGGDKTL